MSSFAGGRQVQPGQLRSMTPAAQQRMKPAVGKVVNTLKSALEALQQEGGVRESAIVGGGHVEAKDSTTQYLCSQVKALQKGFGMLSDAVLEEMDSMRQECRRWQEERSSLTATVQQLVGKLAEVDTMRHDVERFKDEMEQWKLGAADVLADAREEVLTANFQPMEKKIEEMNTVLSGVVKTSSNAQLATINLESRLSSHLKQYEADRCSEKEMFASTRSIMEASEADSALAYESLARDIANLHEDIQVFSSVQKSMAQTSTQHDSALENLKDKVNVMVNHQAKHAKGLEDIIRNLLTDLQGVSKRAKLMDSRTSALEARSSDTYEALARSCQVFAAALQIPCPIPAGMIY